jgi:hypothetical protein
MKKVILTIVLILFIIAIIVAGIRYISGEDDWICTKGGWIQHGHPNTPKPTTPCNLYEE